MSGTNDIKKFEAVEAFRDAAIADGWHAEPTYEGEAFERASRLTRDGYVMQVITRDNKDKGYRVRYDCSVHIWGPDGLSLKRPAEYSMIAIEQSANTCLICEGVFEQTFRYNFAGRACAGCLPKAKAETEKPGWNN